MPLVALKGQMDVQHNLVLDSSTLATWQLPSSERKKKCIDPEVVVLKLAVASSPKVALMSIPK